jgi:ribosomal protein S18 acetylase RimI-like enzyme
MEQEHDLPEQFEPADRPAAGREPVGAYHRRELGTPAGEHALAKIAELVRAASAGRPGGEHPSLWLFRRVLEGELPGGTSRVWPDQRGGLRAAALVLQGGVLVFAVRAGADGEQAAGEVVAWALEYAAEVRTQASSWDDERRALLERLGFVADGRGAVRMARDPTGGAPPAAPPSGFRLRPVRTRELAGYLELFRAAFGDGPSAEARRRLRRNREYRRDLDLVAVAPDGRLAGFCLCFVYGEDNAALGRRDGWVEQMGTHPDLRRRGLGRALLRAGLRALRRRGVDAVYLETGQENEPARALYASEGFHEAGAALWYVRRR